MRPITGLLMNSASRVGIEMHAEMLAVRELDPLAVQRQGVLGHQPRAVGDRRSAGSYDRARTAFAPTADRSNALPFSAKLARNASNSRSRTVLIRSLLSAKARASVAVCCRAARPRRLMRLPQRERPPRPRSTATHARIASQLRHELQHTVPAPSVASDGRPRGSFRPCRPSWPSCAVEGAVSARMVNLLLRLTVANGHTRSRIDRPRLRSIR